MALGRKTGGRQKGSLNKTTRTLKDMILGALDGVGGQQYLQDQAIANPVAFLGLVGKVLPMQVTGEDGSPFQIVIKKFNESGEKK